MLGKQLEQAKARRDQFRVDLLNHEKVSGKSPPPNFLSQALANSETQMHKAQVQRDTLKYAINTD